MKWVGISQNNFNRDLTNTTTYISKATHKSNIAVKIVVNNLKQQFYGQKI